jgi:signal-transduction protein with cAMP-binding, CBS, and nucleotidyltransferase domain
LNSDGEFVTKWGTLGKGDGQFSGPGDIASDPSGEFIYVMDIDNNRVQKFDKNVSSLVVVDEEGQSIGIVTERHITRGVCIHDVPSKEYKIHHLMTSPLSKIEPNVSVEMAANLMIQNKVRHLIVKEADKTVGIVTATNFIDYRNEQLDPVNPNVKVLKTLKDEV